MRGLSGQAPASADHGGCGPRLLSGIRVEHAPFYRGVAAAAVLSFRCPNSQSEIPRDARNDTIRGGPRYRATFYHPCSPQGIKTAAGRSAPGNQAQTDLAT